MMSTDAYYEVVEVGVFTPKETRRDYLVAGDVGYIAAAIKDTVSMFAEEFGLDINNPKEYSMLLNIANLAVSIYSSIKQQMICDELDG